MACLPSARDKRMSGAHRPFRPWPALMLREQQTLVTANVARRWQGLMVPKALSPAGEGPCSHSPLPPRLVTAVCACADRAPELGEVKAGTWTYEGVSGQQGQPCWHLPLSWLLA